jgi:hypothetical protein
MRILSIAAIFALACAGTASAQGVSFEPGQWRYDATIEMRLDVDGETADLADENDTTSQCVSVDDSMIDPGDFIEESCTVSDLQSSSTSMSYNFACSAEGRTGTVNISVFNDGRASAVTTTSLTTEPGVGTMEMTSTIKGTRTGDC